MSRASHIEVSPGYFKLGTQTKGGEQVDIAKLRIFPANKDSSETGRWLLFIEPSIGSHQSYGGRLSQVLTGVAARLSLLPSRLTRTLREALLKPDPVALIADTSALYSGVFEQVVHMRHGLPTHLAIPDQVYMEIQRQRERSAKSGRRQPAATPPGSAPSSSLEEWMRGRNGAPPIAALELVLHRLQHDSGHVLHQIRPADSLVRYFGGERGGGTEEDAHNESGYLDDDDRIAENFYRDRLILEAVRAEQSRLHHLPVWIVTSDENLAVHARQEGFRVGYGERVKPPNPWMIGSPWVDPHTLGLRHVPAQTMLNELVQQWGVITLQEEDRGLLRVWKRTEAKEQALGKTEPFSMQEREKGRWRESRPDLDSTASVSQLVASAQVSQRPIATSTQAPSSVEAVERPVPALLTLREDDPWKVTDWPIQIASLEHTINALLALRSSSPSVVTEALRPKGVPSYLLGLGWAESHLRSGTRELRLTRRGVEQATLWQAVSPTDTKGVLDWWQLLKDIAAQFRPETPLGQLLGLLPPADGRGEQPAVLATKLGWGKAAIQGQIALGHNLGVLVRWDGLVYRTLPVTQAEAASIIQSQIRGATRVDSLFIKVLRDKPLGLPSFRVGLLALYEAGLLSPSGGLPDPAYDEHKPVTLSVIVPTQQLPRKVERQEIDLANGDFLLPGVSCQVVTLREVTR